MYVHNDTQSAGYNLVMGVNNKTKQNRATFIFAKAMLCSQHPNFVYRDPISYQVNGQFIRLQGICIQGNLWLTPVSPEGQGFLNQEVRKEQPISLIVDNGIVVTFETAGVAAVEQALEQSKNSL